MSANRFRRLRVECCSMPALAAVCGLFPGVAMATPVSLVADVARVQGARLRDMATIEFRMEKKRWCDVLEWLCDQTGMPVVGKWPGGGTFTFVGPKDTKYTLPEVVRIINLELVSQKRLLIR